MLEQTIERIAPLIPASQGLGSDQCRAGRRGSPPIAAESRRRHILAEPVGRNTAAAIGLAAAHIRGSPRHPINLTTRQARQAWQPK